MYIANTYFCKVLGITAPPCVAALKAAMPFLMETLLLVTAASNCFAPLVGGFAPLRARCVSPHCLPVMSEGAVEKGNGLYPIHARPVPTGKRAPEKERNDY